MLYAIIASDCMLNFDFDFFLQNSLTIAEVDLYPEYWGNWNGVFWVLERTNCGHTHCDCESSAFIHSSWWNVKGKSVLSTFVFSTFNITLGLLKHSNELPLVFGDWLGCKILDCLKCGETAVCTLKRHSVCGLGCRRTCSSVRRLLHLI